MKSTKIYTILLLSLVVISTISYLVYSNNTKDKKENVSYNQSQQNYKKQQQNKTSNKSLTTQENNTELQPEVIKALDAAINDEYKALATYQAVIEKYGNVRPFTNIIIAEQQHIESLKTIYSNYNLQIPENTYKMEAPQSVQEACKTGVSAEIENAKLYKEQLLPVVQEHEDIQAVFINLMNASQQKHLPAFERCD